MEKEERRTENPALAARHLLRGAPNAALGTVDRHGWPLVTRVALATSIAGAPLLLISRMAAHTRNIDREKRVSLMVEGTASEADPMTAPRLSLVGEYEPLPESATAEAKRRFVARHSGSDFYDTELDFHYGTLVLKEARFNQGFGAFTKLKPTDLLLDIPDDFSEAEPGMVSHMNDDHSDAIAHYATAHLGLADTGSWRLSGLDPEGADLTDGQTFARLPFAAPAMSPTGVREALVALARR